MTEINDYNAEAQKLEDALNAAESEFMWKVRGWGIERHIELFWINEHDPDVLERELGYFPIIAKTKKWYSHGRRMMNLHITRAQVADSIADVADALIEVATDEIHKALVASQ